MARAPHAFNHWTFEGLFLGWGAVSSLVLVTIFAIAWTALQEPLGFLVIVGVLSLFWSLSLWAAFERKIGPR